jgi:hypothetical protein
MRYPAFLYTYMYALPLCNEVQRGLCVFETNAVNIVISVLENIGVLYMYVCIERFSHG